jgi:putative spermidine/putrescine transport system ATP-binding protein
MRAEIRRIHNALGATTIYVTHDQEEALSLADRIVVMRDGEVRQVGTPEELFSRPDHLDVAEFMGFRNSVRGRVVSLDGDMATVDVGSARIAGRLRAPMAVGGTAMAAIRPDDLCVVAPGQGLVATVTASEFRGQEFFAFGRTADGADLSFKAPHRLDTGTTVNVGARPERVLVYAAEAA